MKAWHGQESTHVQAELMTERSREVMSRGPQSILVLTTFSSLTSLLHICSYVYFYRRSPDNTISISMVPDLNGFFF